MMSFRNQVAILRFKGPRFEDHGLDVDVLPEIIVYKRLLQETAKELWRRKHPDRQRLPKNFDDDVSLKFFELQPGSTGVPLVHEPFRAQLPQLFHPELDEAAELIEDTILAADEERGPPAKLPRIVLPLFQTFGDTLRDDEYLSVSTGVDKKASRAVRQADQREDFAVGHQDLPGCD